MVTHPAIIIPVRQPGLTLYLSSERQHVNCMCHLCFPELRSISKVDLPYLLGVRCDGVVNNCASHPCQNKGTCSSEKEVYKCHCVSGYTGPTCATKVNECNSNPCKHGGQCVDKEDSYYCKCKPGT